MSAKLRVRYLPKKLNSKMFSIQITNICNLACGGCDQFCGYIPKEKLWFLDLKDLKKAISAFQRYRDENWSRASFPEDDKLVILHGGEPTLHPNFDEMLQILYSYADIPFVIYTNGRTFLEHLSEIDPSEPSRDISRSIYNLRTLKRNGNPEFLKLFRMFHSHERNVAYRIDYKTENTKRVFVASGCSPMDIEEDGSKVSADEYWKRAQYHCYKWRLCENSIYNGKAYVCNVAAAMDELYYNGKHGWNVEANTNPFNKSKSEIDQQMRNFCYRCGYNFKGGMDGFEELTQISQQVGKGMLVTESNQPYFKPNANKHKSLKIVSGSVEKVPKEVFR